MGTFESTQCEDDRHEFCNGELDPDSGNDQAQGCECECHRMNNEQLADMYITLSGTNRHASDCATSCAPAERPGPCDCPYGRATSEQLHNDPWYNCCHEWKEPPDSEHERDVRCTKCKCPGERDETGDVYWPTT